MTMIQLFYSVLSASSSLLTEVGRSIRSYFTDRETNYCADSLLLSMYFGLHTL